MSTVPQQSSLLSTVLEAGVSKACFHVATELIFEELSAGRGVTLPGLGIPLVSALNATAGEERLYVIGSRGYHILTIMVAYAILALVWAIAGVGNVSNIRGGKAAGMWAMYTSTVWSFFYLVWLCTQWSWTMEKPGWAVVHALV